MHKHSMQKNQTCSYRLAIVGAARRRQGTGAFLAYHFAQLGHPPCAVVGRTLDSARKAADSLAAQLSKPVAAYASIEQLFKQETIDILVIASPVQTHWHCLETAAQQTCHVFCEKPLWWPARAMPGDVLYQKTQVLIEQLTAGKRKLYLNMQWPFTLETYRRLYPSVAQEPRAIEELAMRLSPASRGVDMLVDAAPHLLSMLYALLGDGTIEHVRCRQQGDKHCDLSFSYHHAVSRTAVHLTMEQCPEQPRPAAYAINKQWARRCVKLNPYSLALAHDSQTIPMPDPLIQSVECFLLSLKAESQDWGAGNPNTLLRSMQHLHQLVSAYE